MAYITDNIEVLKRHQEEDRERMQKLSQDADKMEETSLPPDKTLSDFDKIIEAFKKIFSN